MPRTPANCVPRMIPLSVSCNMVSKSENNCLSLLITSASSWGSTPLTWIKISCPWKRNTASPSKKGAAAITRSDNRAFTMYSSQLDSRRSPVTVTCGTDFRASSRSELIEPLITDKATINTKTPRLTPNMDINDTKERKRFLFRVNE